MDDWRPAAACAPRRDPRTGDVVYLTAVFFPDDGDYRAAAAFCLVCPVRPECATYASTVAPRHGWWAGSPRDHVTSDTERRRIGCARCGQPVGASGLRRPGGRWCSLACYRADAAGLPLLHVTPTGDPSPQDRPA